MLTILRKIKLNRTTTRILIWGAFIVFFITVIIPLFYFYYLFDANKVKAMIINQFNNQYYSVVIGGEVEPRSWHGLSLFISDLTIRNKANLKIMHINTANCQLSWLDLVRGRYQIHRIALNGLTFFQSGVNRDNLSDLLDYSNFQHSEFRHLEQLSITNLTWENLEGSYLIKDAYLGVLNINKKPEIKLNIYFENQGVRLNLAGRIDKKIPGSLVFKSIQTKITHKNFKLLINSLGHYNYTTQDLWLESAIGSYSDANFNGKLLIDLALISPYGASVNSLNTVLNNGDYSKSLQLILNHVNSNNFKDVTIDTLNTNYNFKLNKERKIEGSLGLNKMKLESAINITASCALNLNYLESTISLYTSSLKGLCRYNKSLNQLKLNLLGDLDHSPLNFDLIYNNTNESKPQIQLDLKLESLDLANYFKGQADISGLPLYYNRNPLPLNWLAKFNIDSVLNINNLSWGKLSISKIKTNLVVKDNQLKLEQLNANLYNGEFSGIVKIKKNNESYQLELNNQIKHVNLQLLFAKIFNINAISGNANFNIEAYLGGLISYADIYKKMQGKVKLTVFNGGFNGVDFNLLLSPDNLGILSNKPQVRTRFTNLIADFNFESGVSEQSQLQFYSPSIHANGQGKIDFVNSRLDYKLNIKSRLPLNRERYSSILIPVLINGNLFAPKIYIQNMTLNNQLSTIPDKRKNRHEHYKTKHKR